MKERITIGIDMGDKKHNICEIDYEGKIIKQKTLSNTRTQIEKYFKNKEPALVAMEAGTHSRWVSNLISGLGHEVLVGNPRKLRAIWKSDNKTDEKDAQLLARMARFDPELLHPIQHRSDEVQTDLIVIKTRKILVETRTMLINSVRGTLKSMGYRINKCSAECFHKRAEEEMPEELLIKMSPVLNLLEETVEEIKKCDYAIKDLQKKYPETELLQKIQGVGPVTALTYVLTLESPERFKKSRDVGAFLGLTPKNDQSGKTDKQLGITKAGNVYLRSLLVSCARYILGKWGQDCDLRRYGLRIAQRGGKNAKKRAAVAVARKLAVLMHHLWKNHDEYDAFHRENSRKRKTA